MVLLPGCACCGCSEDCCRTKTYSYKDTEPPGKWWDECPKIGNCASGDAAVVGDCAGNVIQGYIVERFCKQSIEGKEIHAYLRKNSTIDDFGTIAGIDTVNQCGILGIINADHNITDELQFVDDGAYLIAKVPFRAENSQIGGPVGASNVVICWCCVDPNQPPAEGGVCLCCAGPPPPPPPSCCSKLHSCANGIVIKKCDKYVPSQCCSSDQQNNESAVASCGGENPPVTSCEENGYFPSPNAPYNCLNGAFQSGAWVEVSGWAAYTGDTSGLSADDIALIAEVEAKVNRTFHVPFDCLGSAQVTLDLGAGESRDTRDCSGAHWFATVTVNLCVRTASVAVYNLACYDATDIQIDLGDLTAISVPCNSWTGCICEGYADTIPIVTVGGSGGGSVTVSSS